MASTTNAGKIWQLLHQNDGFASTLLLGVSKDDTDKVQSALDIVNLAPNDLNLTDQEIEEFMRGVTGTGALEITSWGGYYVTEPLPGSGDKYALFILPYDNTVYWGPESQLIHDFKRFSVPYTLPQDGTLRFSTAAGDVALAFSRAYNMEKGTAEVGAFKGTLGNVSIFGGQTHSIPPWSNEARPTTRAVPRPRSEAVVFISLDDLTDPAPTEPSVPWYSTEAAGNVVNVLGIIGGVVAVIQVFLWIRYLCSKKPRQPSSEQLTAVLTDKQSLALAVASAKVGEPDVDWSSLGTELTNAVEKQLNEELREMSVDFARVDAETVVQSLREKTRDVLRKEFETHAVRAVEKTMLERSDAFKAIPNHLQWARDLAHTIGMGRAAQKYDSFGHDASPSVFDSLGRSVVSKARSEFFYKHSSAVAAEATQANKEASDAAARKVEINEARLELEKEIEQIRDKESTSSDPLLDDPRQELERRKKDLEDELKRMETKEREKRQEAEEHERQGKSSKEQSDKSKEEGERAHEEFRKLLTEHGV